MSRFNDKKATLCLYCDRTGCDEHIKNMFLVPERLKPCSWITDAVIPDDCEYQIKINPSGVSSGRIFARIISCPKFVGQFPEIDLSKEEVPRQLREYIPTYKAKQIIKVVKGKKQIRKFKKVVCVDTGEIYNSVPEVAEQLGVGCASIYNVLSKGGKVKGKTFKYCKEEENKEEKENDKRTSNGDSRS